MGSPVPDSEIAEVVAVNNQKATLLMKNKDICRSCGARYICKTDSKNNRLIRVQNTINARLGDQVLVEQSDKNILILSLMQYGLPLVGFLSAIVIANLFIPEITTWMPREIWLFLIGFVTLIFAGFLIRLWSKRKSLNNFSVLIMKRIVTEKRENYGK